MKKDSKNQVIMVDENNMLSTHNVVDYNADCVQTDLHVLHIKDCVTYVNATHGGLVHLFQVDVPAKVEAENLKQLRRSTALKRVMEFDRSSGGIDLMKWMPWVVCALIIFFK